jgi:membrane-bound serine protease (ClpP class)
MTPVIILFVAGVALIFAEFFVPGGALGVLGGLLVVGSIALGWYRFPEYGVLLFTGELGAVVVVVSIGLYLLFKTPLGDGLVLKAKQDVSEGYADFAQDQSLVGKLAKVHTTLRPAGSIMMGKTRIDAVSNGTFIDAGNTVRIVKVEGHRVVCEEVTDIPGERQRA